MSEEKPTYGNMEQQMKTIAAQIRAAIEVETEENPEAISAKIRELASLTGSAAALQANAKKNLLLKEKELLKQFEKEDLQATILMRKINAESFDEAAWLCYTERLSAGLAHSLDGLRSVLSYIKSELENIRSAA